MKTDDPLAARQFRALVEIPAVVTIFLMMLHVTANALGRAWFGNPIDNTLEIVQYWYLPVIALLGFVAAQSHGQHIATDLVYARLPRVVQPVVLFVVFCLSAVASAGFAWFGLQEAREAQELDMHAGISDVPSWPVYYLVPIVFGVLSVQLVLKAVSGLRGHDLDLEATESEEAMILEDLEEHTLHDRGRRDEEPAR